MIRQMEQSKFARFVAALWQKQGWQTQVTTKSGKSFVALQRGGAEGLIWARPGAGEGVSGKALQQFVMLCKQYGVDDGAVVTPGMFTDDARKIAEGAGVQLVDGEKLRTIVEARELHDLVDRYAADGEDDEDESDDAEDGGLSLPIPASVPPKAVAGVVVAVLAVVLAVVVAPTILGTGSKVEESDWNVTAASTTPDNVTRALDVRWNAERVSEIDPESDDAGVYRPREGERFLLVSMNVTNAGADSVGLRQRDFVLRSNGTLRGHQPLVNASGFNSTVLEEGESVTVWTVFSVDADATNATIAVSEAARHGGLRVRFVRDESLPADP
ncbi:restriction endonuclease [Haladaptatus salinisoli]|uniref:restriction endonuclease n=1 Tax=Haladaptatus salinisoli TaxID=2884876 RepID=UPI001D0A2736|nr:restriction endonuclease [Haladaptatus salinisoli]